ncbi:MAG: hypothetical protein PHC53_01285 [Patescibacteria group bacterium]|nr:hypothetical protein [Patescibacteria group bacterium]
MPERFTNPFLAIEEKLNDFDVKKQIASEISTSGFQRTLKTPQYSEIHTEGETVESHYRLMFNVMSAIQHDGDEKALARLPEPVRGKLIEIEPSVRRTIKEFPATMRYLALVHDLAKNPEGRTFKFSELRLPPKEPEKISQMTWHMLEKFVKSELSWSSAEKTPDSPLQKDARRLYDILLKEGLTGEQIKSLFGMNVHFLQHEVKSADLVKGMHIPKDVKRLLVDLTWDHLRPLFNFSDENIAYQKQRGGNTSASVINSKYREIFEGYSDEKFHLAVSLATLDILSAVPESGKIDLNPIHRIFKARRKLWIRDKVRADYKAAVKATKSQFPELKGVDKYQASPEIKARINKIEEEVRLTLTQKYTQAYNQMEGIEENLEADIEE